MGIFGNISTNYFNIFCFRLKQNDASDITRMIFEYNRSTGEIEVVSDISQESSIPESNSLIKSNPVICCFIGDQVLTRFSDEYEESLFTEIDQDEFYLQKTKSASNRIIESVCRKYPVDKISALMQEKGYFVIDWFFGSSLVPLEKKIIDQNLVLEDLTYSFKDGIISKLEYSDRSNSSFTLDEREFSGESAAMLSALINHLENSDSESSNLAATRKQLFYYKLQRKVFYSGIGFLFALLLINYLIFSSFDKKTESLKLKGNVVNEKIGKIETLEKQLTEYSSIVEQSRESNSEIYAFYSDRIGQLRPNGLWFDALEIHPFLSRIEKGKQINYDNRAINLVGETKQAGPLNSFVKSLMEEKWVEDIQILQYSKVAGGDIAVFKIKILIK